jgi:hypothetical protein
MAHEGIFATKANCDAMAGELVDTTGYSEANINAWCLQAESFLNCLAKYNYSDKFSTLNVDVKYILTEYEARYVAICAISYNMAGYTTRTEAENMINVHIYRMKQIEFLIANNNYGTYMQGA